MADTSTIRLDAADVKNGANWLEILPAVAGIARELLDGKHHPCPQCGGTDRFRLLDAKTGACFCSKCHNTRNGDGLSTIQRFRGTTFPEAIDLVADYRGMKNGNGHHKPRTTRKPLEEVAQAKGITTEGLLAYGAREVNGKVVLPVFDADGQPCSEFSLDCSFGASDKEKKGLFAAGKPAGLFLPVGDEGGARLPQPGELWLVVEGVKDAIRLWMMGYNVIGLNTSFLAGKFARILSGCIVVLVPDRDRAGVEGVAKTAASLYGVAKSIKLAILPAQYAETNGADVRDCCKKPGGEDLVRKCIEAAKPINEKGETREPAVDDIDAAELLGMEFEDERWVVAQLIICGLVILAGKPKCGKSWLALAIALAVVSGGTVLGELNVERSDVLYLALEDNRRRLQRRINKLFHGVLPRGLRVVTKCPRLTAGGREEIERLLDENPNTGLLIVDTFQRLRGDGGSGSAYADDYAAIIPLKEIADARGIAVLVVHHQRKAAAEDPIDSISGTLGLAGAADGLLVLERERASDSATLHVTGRDNEDASLTLAWDRLSCHWKLVGADAARCAKEAQDSERAKRKAEAAAKTVEQNRAKVVKSLADLPKGSTKSDLMELAGLNATAMRPVIAGLLDDKVIVKCMVARDNGQSYSGFRLVTPTHSDALRQISPTVGVSITTPTVPTVGKGTCRGDGMDPPEGFTPTTGDIDLSRYMERG